MTKEIIYIGVDVDDCAFHATAFFPKSGEIVEFSPSQHFKGLRIRLMN